MEGVFTQPPGMGPRALRTVLNFILQEPHVVGTIIIPIFQGRKVRLKECLHRNYTL